MLDKSQHLYNPGNQRIRLTRTDASYYTNTGGLLSRSHGYSSGSFTNHNFYHEDGNGDITYMVNSSQSMVASYRYDPFGNTISSSGTLAAANLYRFSSKEVDPNYTDSGLYYYGYRWYDPNLQRWLNRDPNEESGFETLTSFARIRVGDVSSTDSLIGDISTSVSNSDIIIMANKSNAFAIVANDPISLYDAWGLQLGSPYTGSPGKCAPRIHYTCELSEERQRTSIGGQPFIGVECMYKCKSGGGDKLPVSILKKGGKKGDCPKTTSFYQEGNNGGGAIRG